MPTLIHPELSYQVHGAMLDVHNALGPGYPEAFYEQAVCIALDKRGIRAETQKDFVVHYQGAQVGLFYVDVWVEGGKLLLELKATPAITNAHKAQTISYLKVTQADLGIVANFGEAQLRTQRLPNFIRDRQPGSIPPTRPPDPRLLYPDLVFRIQAACYRVQQELGPGFLGKLYQRAMLVALEQEGLSYARMNRLHVEYCGESIGTEFVSLIIVDGKVLLKVMAVEAIQPEAVVHARAQARSLALPLSMLVSFHNPALEIRFARTVRDNDALRN